MSSKRNIPIGPTIPRSSAFHDITVGESCSDERTVARFYGYVNICGSIVTSNCITARCFLTSPGGAKLENTTLSGLSLPINGSDAANKDYVDSVAQGLEIKDPVQVATTANIILSGTPVVDGYSTIIGDRILVKDQAAGVDNGIYIVSAGVWSRSADLSIGDSASRTAVFVENGIVNGGSTYVCTNDTPGDIVGVDVLNWSLFTQNVQAGLGLYKLGNTLNVGVDEIGIEINGFNLLQLKDGGVTNSKLQNDDITIIAGDGLQNGGLVVLGGSTTIDVDSTVIRTFGNQTKTGNLTIIGTMDATTITDGTITITGGTISGLVDLSITGTLLANTITDGVATLTGGNLTGLNFLNSTTITDGIWSTTAGVQTGAVSIETGTMNASGLITGGSFTDGTATLSGGTLTGLNLPVIGSDAANKTYVDSVSNGMKWKQPVRVATTAAILLFGIQIIDGVATISGNRVLVKDQGLPVQNGIYTVSAGVWTRSTDMVLGYTSSGSVVWTEEGSTQSETGWVVTNDQGSDIIGVDPITWLKWSGTGLVIAGDGLSKVGDTLNVNVDNSTIEIVLDNLQVKPLGITSSQLSANAVTTTKILNGNVTNAKLQNDSVTVTAGDGLINGGSVALGAAVTIDVDSTVVRTFGDQNIGGVKTFTDSIELQETGGGTDSIKFQAPATIASDYTLTFPLDAGVVGQQLTTDGSGVLSWSSGGIIDEIYYGYDSTGGSAVTNVFQTLNIDTNVINDAEYTNVGGVVTVTNAGIYEVTYRTQFETNGISGGTRSTFSGQVELNAVQVPGSRSSCYIREQASSLVGPGCGKTVFVTAAASDNIRVTFSRTVGTSTGQTKTGESSVTIKRLR